MRLTRTAVCALLLALAPAAAFAEPFAPGQVPASARWVMHFDMDTTRAGKLWEWFAQKAVQRNETQIAARIQAFENLTGMKFPQDLHGVTLYGQQFAEHAGVVIIHATLDQPKVVNLARRNPNYISAKFRDYEIHSWKDHGKTLYGTFHGASRLIISQSRPAVEAALDTLDAKAEALPPDSPLAAPAKAPGILFYLAGRELADLPIAQSPLLRQMNSGWLTIAEREQNIVLRSTVQANSPEAADRMRIGLEGVKALLDLAADDENDPHAKAVSSLLRFLSIKVQNKTVTTEWPVSLETFRAAAPHLVGGGARGTATRSKATPPDAAPKVAPKDEKTSKSQ